MSLRLTTAITLIAAAGLVAACNEEDDTSVAAVDDETVIIDEGEVETETAAADGAISPDVVVPDSPRVIGATGGELEAAMTSSGGTPAIEGTVEAESETAMTPVEPQEVPEDEVAEADEALQETEEAIEAAANAVPAEDEREEIAANDAAIEEDAGEPIEAAGADAATLDGADASAEQPVDGTTEMAATDDEAATVTGDGTTEAAALADSQAGGLQPLTDEELASLNLDDLDMESGGGLDRLTAFVEGSDAFDASEKTVIVAGLEAAQDDPEQMQVLFDQIKEIALNAN